MIRLVFDEENTKQLFEELAFRIKSLDSFESIPANVRSVIDECLAGRGFEFTVSGNHTTFEAGERVIKIQVGGDLLRALATLRAMQGDKVVFHVDPPKNQ